MRRREFIGLSSATMALPLAARAQQAERMRRIVVLAGIAASDPEMRGRHGAFLQALQELGWRDGLNVRIEYRLGSGDATNIRNHVAELASLAPDVILTSGAASLGPLLQPTRTVPIVFVNVTDPVGAGFVDSLSRPGGNATGFIQFEFSLSGKWLELLKEVAPGVKRAGVIRDGALTSGVGQFAVIQSVAPSVGVEVSPINASDAGEIERAIAAFARSPNGGLVVTSSGFAVRNRELIIGLASRHKLPAVYYRRVYVTDGGLISYGYDIFEQYRRAAGYVDRIFKVRSRQSYRYRHQLGTNWSSISRRRRRLASPSLQRCLLAPMRSLNRNGILLRRMSRCWHLSDPTKHPSPRPLIGV